MNTICIPVSQINWINSNNILWSSPLLSLLLLLLLYTLWEEEANDDDDVATITKEFAVDCYDQLQTILWINVEAIYEAMTKLL